MDYCFFLILTSVEDYEADNISENKRIYLTYMCVVLIATVMLILSGCTSSDNENANEEALLSDKEWNVESATWQDKNNIVLQWDASYSSTYKVYRMNEKNEYEEYSIRPEDFENDLLWLKENGYTTITSRELLTYLTVKSELVWI